MKVAAGIRILVLGAGVTIFLGCGGDSHSDPGGGARFGLRAGTADDGGTIEFFDDFSGSFPPPHWTKKDGNPFTTPNVGAPPPGLALIAFNKKSRVRGTLKFSTSEPVILSFDVANPEIQQSSRFKFKVRPTDEDGPEASFEIRVADNVLRLEIMGDSEEIPLTGFSSYRKVEFSIDSSASAHWWLDGQEILVEPNWPGGTSQLEFEVTGGNSTKYVVDNVMIKRP